MNRPPSIYLFIGCSPMVALVLALAGCGSGSASAKCFPVYRVRQAADGSARQVVPDGEVCR